MRLCAECGRPASLRSVRSGEESWLCPRCADRLAVVFPIGSFLASLPEPERPPSACPGCGMPQGEWRRTGLVGCPVCYEAFREELFAAATGGAAS
ncbi:MAG: hypothetical protein HYR64_08815 [Fimbriimonas ginsengisoli]|uniref:Uncharacterized protein n=1 Tax=Fimbriimonas ginsengisoli TaxID=1005039 RepID=A0A931LWN8_FIMGI|nr:hypothetical protein [Fimbriimonas ginsengisoli]